MKNKYLRLFVAQTQLMTAEKMRLDRFCQHGEYLAYKIALPSCNGKIPKNSVKFVFAVDLECDQYYFTNENINDEEFTAFEKHLSIYLNTLFQRKVEFESRNEMFRDVMRKLTNGLTEEEQQCLATNIDANTLNVLRALGVEENPVKH